MKILITSIVGFFLLFSVALSGEYHTYPHSKPKETTVQTITHITSTTQRVERSALGIAHAQLQFDKNISNWQVGVGAGYVDKEAYAIGAGKQIGEKSMINFSVGREGNYTGYGVGLNFTIK